MMFELKAPDFRLNTQIRKAISLIRRKNEASETLISILDELKVDYEFPGISKSGKTYAHICIPKLGTAILITSSSINNFTYISKRSAEWKREGFKLWHIRSSKILSESKESIREDLISILGKKCETL